VITQSVQRWATGWTIGVLEFNSRRGLETFLFATASRTALGPTQPPIQWVPGDLSLGVKRPGREADHSPPSSAEVKEYVGLHLHSPNMPSWRGASLSTGTLYLPLSLPLPFTFHLVRKGIMYPWSLSSSKHHKIHALAHSIYYIAYKENKGQHKL
jgi:hypothetical protein